MTNDAQVRDRLLARVHADDLLGAVAEARTLPEDHPARVEIEQLAAHTASPDAYRDYYRVMRGDPCPEGDLFTRHVLVRRFAGIRERILARRQLRVLDLGCLDGWCLLNLGAGGIQGVGVDLSPAALAIARSRAEKYGFRLQFVESAIETFDVTDTFEPGFAPHEFDAVILSEVLEHVLDPAACFRTAARHLAPGGVVYVSSPATPIPHHGKLEDARLHLRVLNETDLRALAREAGLHVVVDHEIIQQNDQGKPYAHRLISFRRARAAVYCNHVTGGWDPTDKGSLTGSEEMVVQVAEQWARDGHEVWVYQNGAPIPEQMGHLQHAGVIYKPREATLPDELDLLVTFKTLDQHEHPARVHVFWTTDLPAPGQGAAFLPPQVVDRLDQVICISKWHRARLAEACPWIPAEKLAQHWLGVDPAEIRAAREAVPTSVPKRAVYASSLDRGALDLLRMWPRVRERVPGAELRILYGLDFWRRSEAVVQEPMRSQMREQRAELERLLRQDGVTYIGWAPTRAEYLREIAAAAVWAYPCTGGELCCKVALEMQALGVLPVVIPVMALSETVMAGAKAKNLAEFESELVRALSDDRDGDWRQEFSRALSARIPVWADLAAFLWQSVAGKLAKAVLAFPDRSPETRKDESLPDRFPIPSPRAISRYKLDLLFWVNGMAFDGETDKKSSLGGSETSALQLSRALVKRGHHVTVFSNCKQAAKFDGVAYIPIGDFGRYVGYTPHDVCVVQRDPSVFRMPIASKLNVLWMHDLALHRYSGQVRSALWAVDYVVPVSHWHGRQLAQVYGLTPEVLAPMRNGIEADRALAHGQRRNRERKWLVYAARPERGLKLLLERIYPRLLERDPELVLMIAGYENTVPEMQPLYDYLNKLCDGFGPRVKRVGALTKDQLYELYSKSRLYCYPTETFEEVSPVRGDTLVDTPAGKFPIASLVGRSGFLVYAYDERAGRVALARVKGVRRTRVNAKMVTVRYRHGQGCKASHEGELTLTPDHEVMLRDGRYVPAGMLQPGDRLMPFNRSKAGGTYKTKAGRVPLKYTRIHLNDGQLVSEAKFCLEWKLGRPLRPGEHVDHIDGNPNNNDPSNLQVVLGHSGHQRAHRERMLPEELEADRQRRTGYFDTYHASLSRRQMHLVKRRAAVIRWERHRAALNHIVVSVTSAPNADGYCMEVEPHHNFVANGIVVHNCISLMEAAACGLPFVASAWGALPETAGYCPGASRLVPHTGEPTDKYVAEFVDAVWEVLSNDLVNERMRKAGLNGAKVYDWGGIAQEWESFLLGAIEDRNGDRRRLAKHFWRIGDIYGAKLVEEMLGVLSEDLPPDEPPTEIPPSVLNAVANAAAQQGKPATVRALAPQSQETARLVAGVLGARLLGSEEGGPADLVVGVETLDCAPDPTTHVEAAEQLARTGGTVCLVTAGPAVQQHRLAQGAPRRARWVFDQHDIRDLLTGKRDLLALVVGGNATSAYDGTPLSWNAYAWKTGSGPTGEIDRARRLALQVPRLSLTATMITHNADGMLRRCVRSFRPYVDELVVADGQSTDQTRAILAEYGATIVEGLDPKLHGFDAARNVVLPHVTGDLILWIDSDEELLDQQHLPKYLRWNMFGGYALRQHHFSAVPENAFKPDLPVRIFRRVLPGGKETRITWFGQVHEHPEIAINRSVGESICLSDVHIAHVGYLTETIRRRRFDRNIQLMFRDRAKYPDRMLGKLLMIRDWCHLARYEAQAAGGQLSPTAAAHYEAALEMFRKEFLGKAHTLALDGMQYYHEAVLHLGRGFDVEVVVRVGWPDGQPRDVSYRGRIASLEDLQTLLGGAAKELGGIWKEKYL